ncbi:Si:ch211-160d20.3 protein-like [Scleropages formosus]|uniref:Si:ch211-160d20.3 protein-like n=1 Tax=Scleropages formosus TaxID=113540 RepID=A0A0P7TKT0_SCLFO|nr:Si:ch211-160d20.3 protein-like [Scleropages formosus]
MKSPSSHALLLHKEQNPPRRTTCKAAGLCDSVSFGEVRIPSVYERSRAQTGRSVSEAAARSRFPANMASVTTATSEWIQFFKDAGIPPGLAVNYAVSFVDNRIQKTMLMDLSKEIMMDLGITDMCKMATEAITSGQTSVQAELRRAANTPATRMIANSLSRESPPSTPVRRPDNRLSVTVSNKQASTKAVLSRPADEGSSLPVKRRRVTAEMEGKYIINMPKGTTARTRRILEQQAKREKALKRTSVFERLGAESKADTTTGSKPTGVFSRLGGEEAEEEDEAVTRRPEAEEEQGVEDEDESDGEGSVLQYAGVLKRPPPTLKRTAIAATPASGQLPAKVVAKKAPITLRRLGTKSIPATSPAAPCPSSNGLSSNSAPAPKPSILKRLGKVPPVHASGTSSTAPPQPPDTQDSRVTSSRTKAASAFTLASSKVSSSTGAVDCQGAQMDHTGTVSVFKRLGTKKT